MPVGQAGFLRLRADHPVWEAVEAILLVAEHHLHKWQSEYESTSLKNPQHAVQTGGIGSEYFANNILAHG